MNKDKILVDSFFDTFNQKQKVYLTKSYFTKKKSYQYFIKIISKNSEYQGYLYFYLDFENLESQFIGIYIKPDYRNTGLASLLLSYWIRFCLDNNFSYLSTNKKQRKPFLLFLLKIILK